MIYGLFKTASFCQFDQSRLPYFSCSPKIQHNMVGSHEELYRAMETDRVDLVLNDQRRAFSDRYNNEILAESRMYIEISSRNTLGHLELR